MDIRIVLTAKVKEALAALYEVQDAKISFEKTNANFAGDYTFVVFPYLRASRKKPEDTAAEMGEYRSEEHTSELQSRSDLVCRLPLEKKKNKHKSRREFCDRYNTFTTISKAY